MMAQRHLVVLLKVPRIGRTKTRLAADIGAVAAWRFSRLCLDAVLRRLGTDRRWRVWLAVSPDDAVGRNAYRWPLPGAARLAQGGGNLGARMERPFHSLGPGPVVLIGADVPQVEADDIAAAFACLGDHDAVFGPAADGGFWLVGFRRHPAMVRRPFAGVRWSGPHALADTLGNLRGRRVGFVARLDDVDDGADYEALRRRAARISPITRRATSSAASRPMPGRRRGS